MTFFTKKIVYVINGPELKKARWKKVMKQKDLAAKAGISNSFLCDLERGNRNCSPEVAKKLIIILR